MLSPAPRATSLSPDMETINDVLDTIRTVAADELATIHGIAKLLLLAAKSEGGVLDADMVIGTMTAICNAASSLSEVIEGEIHLIIGGTVCHGLT